MPPLNVLNVNRPKQFLSIDFGRTFLKIAAFKNNGDSVVLLDYDIKNIVFAEQNKEEMVSFITDFLSSRSISAKSAYLTLSDPDSVMVKMITLPVMSPDETLEAVRWQFNEEKSFDANTGVIHWQLIREYTQESAEKRRDIAGILTKREAIDRCLSVIKDSRLIPLTISSQFFNYGYLLSRLKNHAALAAVLHIGSKKSSLCIYKNSQLCFIRDMSFSLDKIATSLTETLYSSQGKIELSLPQAEGLLKEFGIPENQTGILRDNIQANHVISLIRPFLETLAKEIKLTFSYFNSNFKEGSPHILYMTGGGANLKRLDTYLANELNFKVKALPLPKCIDIGGIERTTLEINQNQMMSAFGATFAEQGGINLLPWEIKTKKIEALQSAILRLFTIIGAALFFIFFLMINTEVRESESKLELAQKHLQSVEYIKDLKKNVHLKEKFIDALQKGKVPDHVLLRILSKIVPNTIVLDGLTMNMTGHKVQLKGRVSADVNAIEVLTKFMKALEDSMFFTDVSLLNSENKSGDQTFEIECSLVQ